MNMKFSRSHFRLQALNKPVSPCEQDRTFRVLTQEEIQGLATEENLRLLSQGLRYGIRNCDESVHRQFGEHRISSSASGL